MFKAFVGDTTNTAVSQCEETNKQRDVLTKQVKAGQQTVVATAPKKRDGGSREVITSNHEGSFEDWLSGVPSSTSSHTRSKLLHMLAVVRESWIHSRTRIVAEEVRNFPRRIAEILRHPMLRFGATVPPCPSSFQDWNHFLLAPNSYLHACKRDMQSLLKKNRWMGMVDVQIALQAWRLGVGWNADSLCSESGNMSQACSYSPNPEDGNFMPPQAVRQSSKCDQLTPLP
jgi:hypothetical protein